MRIIRKAKNICMRIIRNGKNVCMKKSGGNELLRGEKERAGLEGIKIPSREGGLFLNFFEPGP